MTLAELAAHHRKQAEHYRPFGENTGLIQFHTEAAALCESAIPYHLTNFGLTRLASRLEDCAEDNGTGVVHEVAETLRNLQAAIHSLRINATTSDHP